jgi:hypothetical protein
MGRKEGKKRKEGRLVSLFQVSKQSVVYLTWRIDARCVVNLTIRGNF